MTNLQYARLLIKDNDTTNLIFSDEELQELLKQNTRVEIFQAEQLDVEGKLWKIPAVHIDDTYTPKVFVNGIQVDDASVNFETGEIVFSDSVEGVVTVEAKIVDWNNFRADAFEIIATDFRKLNSFSIQNANRQFDDMKSHLLRLAKMYRTARGVEL